LRIDRNPLNTFFEKHSSLSSEVLGQDADKYPAFKHQPTVNQGWHSIYSGGSYDQPVQLWKDFFGFFEAPPRAHHEENLDSEESFTLIGHMPESGRRVFATHHALITKTIEAPIKYVHEWCTDYRSDDGKFSKTRHEVIHVGSDRVVRIIERITPIDSPRVAVELVRLIPPDAWHKDQIGVRDLDSMDYKLARLSSGRTRLTVSITERWMTRKHPTRSRWVRNASKYWDSLVAALEEDYRTGMPAKG
jgi:hypothetical protein